MYPHGPEPPGGARTGASSEAPVQVRGSREVSRDRVTESQSPKYVSLKGTQRRASLPPHFCPVMYIVPFFWRPQVHREEA